MIARNLLIFVLAFGCCQGSALARVYPSVEVTETYLNLRTGPGRGYPTTQIVEQGARLEILQRRAGWIKVKTEWGLEAWVQQQEMANTLDPSGESKHIRTVGEGEFAHRSWELGVKIGTFEQARTLGAYLAYFLTENLSLEGTFGEAYGVTVDFRFYNLSITHQPWPQWRYSPYFTMGGGQKETSFSETELQTSDRTDQTLHAGLGLRVYVTRQLMVRAEYRSTVILTNQDDNDESDEWTLGISAFF